MSDVKIDANYLLEIAGNEREMVISIVNDFNEDSKSLLDKLKLLTSEGDLSEVAGLLHKWKGSSGSLGMVSLNAEIIKMESWDKLEWDKFEAWSELQDHLEASVVAAGVVLEG